MSEPVPAASPAQRGAGRDIALTNTVDPAHAESVLGCPNCGDVEHIVIDVPSTTHHVVRVYGIRGVTEPEYEITGTSTPDGDEPIDKITKIRCLTCRWAFTGADCLQRLR